MSKDKSGEIGSISWSATREDYVMSDYQSPNAADDAPVVHQIVVVLAGFALATAVIALIINVAV